MPPFSEETQRQLDQYGPTFVLFATMEAYEEVYGCEWLTGNYSDLGEQEEMRRDYEADLARWNALSCGATVEDDSGE